MRIAVIGIGLIGGSIALGARQRLGACVAAYDESRDAVAAALELGAVDRAGVDIPDAVEAPMPCSWRCPSGSSWTLSVPCSALSSATAW